MRYGNAQPKPGEWRVCPPPKFGLKLSELQQALSSEEFVSADTPESTNSTGKLREVIEELLRNDEVHCEGALINYDIPLESNNEGLPTLLKGIGDGQDTEEDALSFAKKGADNETGHGQIDTKLEGLKHEFPAGAFLTITEVGELTVNSIIQDQGKDEQGNYFLIIAWLSEPTEIKPTKIFHSKLQNPKVEFKVLKEAVKNPLDLKMVKEYLSERFDQEGLQIDDSLNSVTLIEVDEAAQEKRRAALEKRIDATIAEEEEGIDVEVDDDSIEVGASAIKVDEADIEEVDGAEPNASQSAINMPIIADTNAESISGSKSLQIPNNYNARDDSGTVFESEISDENDESAQAGVWPAITIDSEVFEEAAE